MKPSLLDQTVSAMSVVFISVLIVGGGCTFIHDEPTQPVALEKVPKIDLKVELRQPSSLFAAKCEQKVMWDTYRQPLGKALSVNSEAAAKAVFEQVTINSYVNTTGGPCANGTDAILIPALASVERDYPSTIFSTQTMSMQFTWTLLDCEGNLLWATTIAGEGKGPMGNPQSKNAGQQQVDNVLKEVFSKSVKEMSASDIIRQYAANLKKDKAH